MIVYVFTLNILIVSFVCIIATKTRLYRYFILNIPTASVFWFLFLFWFFPILAYFIQPTEKCILSAGRLLWNQNQMNNYICPMTKICTYMCLCIFTYIYICIYIQTQVYICVLVCFGDDTNHLAFQIVIMEVLLTIVVCLTTWAFQCNQPLSIFKAYLDPPRLQNFDPQTKKKHFFLSG